MKVEIKRVNAKWLINGKEYNDASYQERIFLNHFFREVKIGDYDNKQ